MLRASDIPFADGTGHEPNMLEADADDRPSSPSRSVLAVKRAADLIDAPRPVEIVEGVAYADCVSVLVSESGTGKTFLLLDMSGAVSDGASWHGRSTRSGSVVYASFEGDALGLRLRALRDATGRRLDHLYVIRARDPLSPRITRDGELPSVGENAVVAALDILAAELTVNGRPPIVLVVIDTVRASLAGSEDSSEHVSAYLRAVRRLMATVPGAAVVLAHHAGWQDGDTQRKRERGSSAWRGNVDATLYLEAGDHDAERGDAALVLKTLKLRDAERPTPLRLIRRRVELLEMDARGEPVTSCVIDRDFRTREDREEKSAELLATEHRAIDLRTLRTIADRPDMASSQDRIRLVLGVRKTVVTESLTRLVRMGWVTPGARSQPYAVTPAGHVALGGQI